MARTGRPRRDLAAEHKAARDIVAILTAWDEDRVWSAREREAMVRRGLLSWHDAMEEL